MNKYEKFNEHTYINKYEKDKYST